MIENKLYDDLSVDKIEPNEQYFEGIKYAQDLEILYRSYIERYQRIITTSNGQDKHDELLSLFKDITFQQDPRFFSNWVKTLAVKMTSKTWMEEQKSIRTNQRNIIQAKILILYQNIKHWLDQYSDYYQKGNKHTEIYTSSLQDNGYNKRIDNIEKRVDTILQWLKLSIEV